MQQLQRLFASFVLVCVLALSAAADGIIHTGTPPPPPPPQINSVSEEPAEESAGEESSVFETATSVALGFLRDALTLF